MPLDYWCHQIDTASKSRDCAGYSSLDIFIRNIAAKSVLCQKESIELRHDHIRHGTVLGELINSNLFQGTDYLLTRLNFGSAFESRIPIREEWAADSVLRDFDTSIITDESKRVALVQVYFLMTWVLR